MIPYLIYVKMQEYNSTTFSSIQKKAKGDFQGLTLTTATIFAFHYVGTIEFTWGWAGEG